jgi:hypothetical protein
LLLLIIRDVLGTAAGNTGLHQELYKVLLVLMDYYVIGIAIDHV